MSIDDVSRKSKKNGIRKMLEALKYEKAKPARVTPQTPALAG
jgi:hypothetical protein